MTPIHNLKNKKTMIQQQQSLTTKRRRRRKQQCTSISTNHKNLSCLCSATTTARILLLLLLAATSIHSFVVVVTPTKQQQQQQHRFVSSTKLQLPKTTSQQKSRRLESTTSNDADVTAVTASDDDDDNDDDSITSAQLLQLQQQQVSSPPALQFRTASYDLACASFVGILTGYSVAIFKLTIETVRCLLYDNLSTMLPLVFIPALGGICVGLILLLSGPFPPGLRGTVQELDRSTSRWRIQANSFRKSLAAVMTLGTGCSLGPEGPCVEIGLSVARASLPTRGNHVVHWNRILLACGAAAGVAAGFDAPVSGVFFALEVMQNAYTEEDSVSNSTVPTMGGLFSSTSTITPVLIASVLSALCARSLLGQHLIFQLSSYSLPNPLLELPMFLLLGCISGTVAFSFRQAEKVCSGFFSGDVGPPVVRNVLQSIPTPCKPLLGGLFCGVVGLLFPQILFFGYETLNVLLSGDTGGMSIGLLLSLLLVKAVCTAVSAGSGLVGGTFAPALFLGAITGASYHTVLTSALTYVTTMFTNSGTMPTLLLADLPAYAMVGSASVLAALFRAPLTASLLLFEISRDYDVILPLIAAAGVGSVIADILEDKFTRWSN